MLNLIINRLRLDDRAASMVEYALLVVLIAVAGFLAVAHFGNTLGDTFDTIATSMTNAAG